MMDLMDWFFYINELIDIKKTFYMNHINYI